MLFYHFSENYVEYFHFIMAKYMHSMVYLYASWKLNNQATGICKIEILKTYFFTISRSILDLKEAVGPLMRVFIHTESDFQSESWSAYC